MILLELEATEILPLLRGMKMLQDYHDEVSDKVSIASVLTKLATPMMKPEDAEQIGELKTQAHVELARKGAILAGLSLKINDLIPLLPETDKVIWSRTIKEDEERRREEDKEDDNW